VYPLSAPVVDGNARIPYRAHFAEAPLGFLPCRARGASAVLEVAGVHLEVELQLGIHILTDVGLPESEDAAPSARLGRGHH